MIWELLPPKSWAHVRPSKPLNRKSLTGGWGYTCLFCFRMNLRCNGHVNLVISMHSNGWDMKN